MGSRVSAFQRNLEREFDGTGLTYHVVANGKKHRKLYIDGRMVMVFSHGARAKDTRFVKSLIKRTLEAKHVDRVGTVQRPEEKRISGDPDGRTLEIRDEVQKRKRSQSG